VIQIIISYKSIGIIHSPHKTLKGTPIQPKAAKDIEGTVEVFSEFVKGLKDIEGFSHIILLYHFHLVKNTTLLAKPFMDNEKHGIFAIRGPSRPNPIGISVVRLNEIYGNILHVQDIDIVDKTPLLDIKPYVPEFDKKIDVRIGWLEKKIYKLPKSKNDGRFR